MNEEHLKNIPLFANLGNREQREISKQIKLEQYKTNEVIFNKGSESDALYIIEDGRVSLSVDDKTTLANLGPGSLLGEADFFQGLPRATTAKASSKVNLWVLDSNALETLIKNNPQIGLNLSQGLGSHLIQMTEYLSQKLAEAPSMQMLSAQERNLIAGRLSARQFEERDVIFYNATPPVGLFLIEDGRVRLLGEDDNDYTELSIGEVFGEMAILSGKNHAHTAQAAEQTVVWQLSVEDFDDLTANYPEIRATLSRNATSRLSQADQDEAIAVLKHISLFSELPTEALEDATSRLMLRHVPANEAIFKVGDPGDAMYIVETGTIEVIDQSGNLIARHGQGDYIDELALMTGKSRTTSAKATVNSNLWALYRFDFDALLVRYPKLSTALSKSLRERLNSADNQFVEKHLKKLALQGGLSRLQLDDMSNRLRARRYRTNDIIYQEGQPGQELYFIENGQVERFTSAPNGPVALPILGQGDFFGETSLLSGRPHSLTTRAQTDLDVWVLSKADFDELVYKYPNLSTLLNRVMSERLVETMDIMRTGASNPTRAIPALTGATPPMRVVNQQTRPVSRGVPPVPVRPVAPPPSPHSRPVPPTMRRNQTSGTTPLRTTGPVKVANGSQAVRPAARPNGNTGPANKAQPTSSNRNGTRGPKNQATATANIARGATRVSTGMQSRIDSVSQWYTGVPLGTRVGLFVLVLLLGWMCGIVGPASIISALAATIFSTDEVGLVQNGEPMPNVIAGEISQRGFAAALPFVETITPTPSATASPTTTPSPSATVTQTPIPTFTPTPTSTPTPVDTPTVTPTSTSTNTPVPTRIPATRAPRLPTETPTPAPTPTPDADFVVKQVRKLTPCENQGKHHIYVRVIDVNGQGLNNIPVKIAWGPNSGDNVIAKTENKDKGAGFIEFAMFKGVYSVQVVSPKSQIASGITPDYEVDQGCAESGSSVGNSLFHASFEVIIQRTY